MGLASEVIELGTVSDNLVLRRSPRSADLQKLTFRLPANLIVRLRLAELRSIPFDTIGRDG